MPQTVPQDVLAELAPSGVLRAGINLSNFLLVSGKSATGEPEGERREPVSHEAGECRAHDC